MTDWLDSTRLVVCVGSGGVGKTTTAAALGLAGALRGRKAMVLTIDPAKRLANSLGLDQMGGEPTQIDLSSLDAPGELWAAMLDSRGTFDALIASMSPTPEARDRILNNHVYRHMADAFAGSQDYMATEKLYDLVRDGRWDLVILDTPPVKNALDFLESPGRVVGFLDERVLGWFLSPYEETSVWGARRLIAGTSAFLFRLLGYVFGKEFLDDFAEFLQAFRGLYDGFRERHQAVVGMLRDEATSFVTVTAPTEPSIDVAVFFQRELAARDLPRAGTIVNQVHRCDAATDDAEATLGELARSKAEGLPEGTADALLSRLTAAHGRLRHLVETEHMLEGRVREAMDGEGWFRTVPRFEGEVHDLEALKKVGDCLIDESC